MKEKAKTRAVKLFILFLVAMFIMTFASRVIYAEKLPRITYTMIQQQRITHTEKFYGTMDGINKMPVYVPEGLRIESVPAECGDSVGRSSVLIQLDRKYLSETIDALEKEIASELENSMTYSAEGQVPVFTEPGLRVMQICASTGDTVNKDDIIIRLDTDYLGQFAEKLRKELNAGIVSRNELYSAGDTSAADAMSGSIEEMQKDYDKYRLLYEAGGVIKAPISGILTDIQVAVGGMTSDTAAFLISSSPELSSSVEQSRKRLEELKVISENDGKICSPELGIITDVLVDDGGVTDNMAAFMLCDAEKGLVFTTVISREDTGRIAEGDKVSLSFRNGNIRLSDCEVRRLVKDKKSDGYKVRVKADDDRLKAGEPGELTVNTISSELYECIPLSAVNESPGDGYIYYIEETAGFLGKEYIVHRLDIKIADQNGTLVAIKDAPIDEKVKIVMTSSKELSEGQKVRLE